MTKRILFFLSLLFFFFFLGGGRAEGVPFLCVLLFLFAGVMLLQTSLCGMVKNCAGLIMPCPQRQEEENGTNHKHLVTAASRNTSFALSAERLPTAGKCRLFTRVA